MLTGMIKHQEKIWMMIILVCVGQVFYNQTKQEFTN